MEKHNQLPNVIFMSQEASKMIESVTTAEKYGLKVAKSDE